MTWLVLPQLIRCTMLPGVGAIGAFVGSLTGGFTGALVETVMGAPPANTSIPLICGLSVFRTNSIVIVPSLTNVVNVRI